MKPPYYLVETKREDGNHKDDIDILQRVLELCFVFIWSFHVTPNDNHTDNDDNTGKHKAQYSVEIFVDKICIRRSEVGVTLAKNAPGRQIF